ncbi:MAG: hypothetical protein HQK83_01125 [Fibrobacteria bacterium]|nr:hypothetical protein [Fibrobacteria bacterium]
MFFCIYTLIWSLVLLIVKAAIALRLKPQWRLYERIHFPQKKERGSLWFHCASLGEAKGVRGLLGEITLPANINIITTASTTAGADYLKTARPDNLPPERFMTHVAPLDHPKVLKKFLRAYRVIALILYEMELWPNTINLCTNRQIPILLVSARLSNRAKKIYGLLPQTFTSTLNHFDWIQAQDKENTFRIQTYTKTPVRRGTDFKAAYFLKHSFEHPIQQKQTSTFSFVSLHLRELKILMQILPGLMNTQRVIILPRYQEEMKDFVQLLQPFGIEQSFNYIPGQSHLLITEKGHVMECLNKSRFCFVGGSLIPNGCHNLWEPLTCQNEISFGPHFDNQEYLAHKLLDAKLASVINRPEDLLNRKNIVNSREKIESLICEIQKDIKTASRAVEQKLKALLPIHNY